MTLADSQKPTVLPVVTFEQKEQQEIAHRQQLLDDLLNQRLEFKSQPYEAHVQFSNFCNMSCIMCWDGRNPPTEKAPPELLEKIDTQVAPHLSVITPYSGSEPLVLSWEETREMAVKNSVLLCITTNGQYLDEKRFLELKDITETLLISIDSHIPEVMEIVRPGGNIKKVFDNLATAARLSKEHNVECIVNVVLLTHNAPHLSETVEWLANLGIETVNVIQLLDVNGRSSFYDPLLHFSSDYIAWVKKRCLKSAKEKQIRLIWSVAGCVDYDYRPKEHVLPLQRKLWNDSTDNRMRRLFPGFCRNVFNRLRIDRHGDVAPCCYATQGKLSLGNLHEKDFNDIWNGPEARDLRRGMLTGDVPAHCSSCRYIDPIGPQSDLEFIEQLEGELAQKFPGRTVATQLQSRELNHGKRWSKPAELTLQRPDFEVQEFKVALSFGGETDEVFRFDFQTKGNEETISIPVPENIWQELRTNVGYWWNVWAIPKSGKLPIQRISLSPVLIRQQDIDRIKDSQLGYVEKGDLPIIDLGVSKELGWATPGITPTRPETQRTDVVAKSSNGHSKVDPGKTEPKSLWKRMFGRKEEVLPRDPNWTVDGYFDQIVEEAAYIHITGWIMFVGGPADSVEFGSANGKIVKAKTVGRPDLEVSMAKYPNPDRAGFEVKLKKADFSTDTGFEFEIIAKREGAVATRIAVTKAATGEASAAGPFWIGKKTRLTLG